MEGTSIVQINCKCKATNYIFLGDQTDLTGPEYYFFECWSCHKYGLLGEEWAIRDILMIPKEKDIMKEAPSYSVEGHRFPDVDEWVEPFLDKPYGDRDKNHWSSIRAWLASSLMHILGEPTLERKKWLGLFLGDDGPCQSLRSLLGNALTEYVVKDAYPDDEDLELEVTRRMEDVMTRLLYLEGCP